VPFRDGLYAQRVTAVDL